MARKAIALSLLCVVTVTWPCLAGEPAPAAAAGNAAAPRMSLEDLYSQITLPDAAISPSGQYVAIVRRTSEDDQVVVRDLKTSKSVAVARIGRRTAMEKSDGYIVAVYWKSDQRLLFRTRLLPVEGAQFNEYTFRQLYNFGDRLFAIDRDGSHFTRLMHENTEIAIEGALDLGAIAHLLPKDPDHILMLVSGFGGPSLFRVDIRTGKGEQVEKPNAHVINWWLDMEGRPVVRVEVSSGTMAFFRRLDDGSWKRYYKVRLRDIKERADYQPIGPSDQAGRYYVLARPPGSERVGVYNYDFSGEAFGEAIIQNDTYDLDSAEVSRDGSKIVRWCYLAHVRICEFADQRINAHLRGVRKFFSDSADVTVFDASDDLNVLLLRVSGPQEAPSYYYYQVEQHNIQALGAVREATVGRAMPSARVISYQARDGLALTGYLTVPPGAASQRNLPLVVYPHGGPEVRDHLAYDPWVQYLAASGYAVFQPNFRGSDGFGKSFAERGYGEWGRKMQDDVLDGVDALVREGSADQKRICIVGISYGGYAALAGAALSPERYRCAVSVAGVADPLEFIYWRKHNWGTDSEGYKYWLKSIGDPAVDRARILAVSPVKLAAAIKVPVLLLHGTDDDIVPIEQSQLMAKALTKAGRATEVVRVEHEDHPSWSDAHEMFALRKIGQFLSENLGPGFASDIQR